MREYIVQYERKEADNPKDKCDLCNHAIVGEVVRCKDCKHGQYDATHYFCAEHGHKVYEDDFCSYGERRDE